MTTMMMMTTVTILTEKLRERIKVKEKSRPHHLPHHQVMIDHQPHQIQRGKSKYDDNGNFSPLPLSLIYLLILSGSISLLVAFYFINKEVLE